MDSPVIDLAQTGTSPDYHTTILTPLVAEFVDTVVVHIQHTCNIRLHLVLLDFLDLDGYNCHHIVVCKTNQNEIISAQFEILYWCFSSVDRYLGFYNLCILKIRNVSESEIKIVHPMHG